MLRIKKLRQPIAPKPGPIDKGWFVVGALSRMVIRTGSTSLALHAQQTPGGSDALWNLFAIETDAGSMEGVLDSHAHQLVAKNITSINEVIRYGDNYVAKWMKKNKVSKTCPCGPIDAIPVALPYDKKKYDRMLAEAATSIRSDATKAARGGSKSAAKTRRQRKPLVRAPSGQVYFDLDVLEVLRDVKAKHLIAEKQKRSRKRAG